MKTPELTPEKYKRAMMLSVGRPVPVQGDSYCDDVSQDDLKAHMCTLDEYWAMLAVQYA